MPRKSSAIEVNNFVGGLITEASPLTFPPNASIDEVNFLLKRDGSRRRRFGMDYEDDSNGIIANVTPRSGEELAVTTFRWVDVSGNVNLQLVVVQTGNVLKFFNINRQPLSSLPLYTYTIEGMDVDHQVSYANADGSLVVATGQRQVIVFSYDGTEVTATLRSLLVRDSFGVEDIDPTTGLNLREGANVAVRPTTLTDAHLYNLRNQSWALPARPGNEEYKEDNIYSFYNSASYRKYPSNADVASSSLYPLTDDTDDRIGDRFHATAAINDDPTTTDAPRGFFIIDALNRGQSRLEEYQKYLDRFSTEGINDLQVIKYNITGLPVDQTYGGASVVEGFAGRVCYAGFNGDLSGADKHSPRLSSYVLISRLIEDPSDVNKCYQKGDPTTPDESDLLDTDGLFVRISGAKNIRRMIALDSSLLIFAENGVWAIEGGSDYGFSATNFKVTKVSNSGCEGPYSAVYIDDSVVYWAKDGIYSVSRDERGAMSSTNLTEGTIQTYYNEIESREREFCQGHYQSVERKIRWLFNNRPVSEGNPKELILDLSLGAFYPWEVGTLSGGYPKVVAMIDSPEYSGEEFSDNVLYNGVLIEHDAEQVVVAGSIAESRTRSIFYVTLSEVSPVTTYSFSKYKDPTFYDWKSVDEVGTDQPAYLLTGWMPGEDFQRNKQAVYTTFHFNRTEDGVELVDGQSVLTNPSSCIVQAQWDWANSAESNRWGREFQAYRLNRHYTISGGEGDYNPGFETVQTKNKMRGKGKVLSMLLRTEAGKDCQLLGWSMVLSGNTDA